MADQVVFNPEAFEHEAFGPGPGPAPFRVLGDDRWLARGRPRPIAWPRRPALPAVSVVAGPPITLEGEGEFFASPGVRRACRFVVVGGGALAAAPCRVRYAAAALRGDGRFAASGWADDIIPALEAVLAAGADEDLW